MPRFAICQDNRYQLFASTVSILIAFGSEEWIRTTVRIGYEPSNLPLIYLAILVRIVGFEPTTTQFQTVDSTRLSYILN